MSIYTQNLDYLCRRFPGFKEEIIDSRSPSQNLEVMSTPSGSPTAKTEGFFLHSRHDPVKEADRIAVNSLDGREDCIVVEGFGLGYTAEALIRKAPDIPLLVVEPDASLFLALLAVRPMTHIFSHPGVSIILEPDPEVLVSLLSKAGYVSIKVVRHRPLSRLFGSYFNRMEEALASYIARKDINRNTLRRFGRLWVRNLVRNLPVLASARGTEHLHERFVGIPSLLLAAGPSVEEILPHLSALRERFLLAAVDTSAQLLWERGIDPDILVVVDPQYWNTRHLDGVSFSRTVLVSESSTHPRVFHLLDLPVFFGGSIFPLGRFLEGYTGIRGKLGAGGSVSTSAWDILRRCGCSTIFCAGLDLGFPGFSTHYRNCRFEHMQLAAGTRFSPSEGGAYHALRDADPFYVENYAGGKTLTDRRLIVYKWWFESQFRMYPEPPTFTLSREGVKLEGMEYTPVDRLLAHPPCRKEIDRRLEELPAPSEGRSDEARKILQGVKELGAALSGLQALAEEALAAVGTAEKKQKAGVDFSSELSVLDSIDSRVLSSSSKDIAGFLMQDFISEVSAARTPDNGASALETSAAMYTNLAEAAAYHSRLLEEAASFL